MDALKRVSRAEALGVVPDTPATLEMRDIALHPDSAIHRSGDGLLLVHAQGHLAGAFGAVAAPDVARLLETIGPHCELLADRAALAGWPHGDDFERAIVHTLDRPWQRPAVEIAELVIRPLAADDPLDHLPDELRREIDVERAVRPVLVGFIAGRAASFAYCPARTETYADIAIDTLEPDRNRGVGAAVVSALVEHIVAANRVPVWGALEDNHASLRLAEKLGFTQYAGEVFVYDP